MKIDLKAEIKGPDLSRTIDVLSINLGSHDLFELNEPCVDHDQNDLNVVYHFNDYASNGDITYSYRLLPLDETWRSTSDRSLTYSDLNPGTYQFELTAFDAYGKEYSISSPIRFEIEKAWWQMNVFKGLALFSFIGLTFYFVKRREKQQRALIEHERELNKRIADLQMQSLRSQMNPHFIFNSLGSIQYYIQTNKVDEADNYLTLFAQLMRRYLNSAIENMISLREEVSLLYEYTTLEMMRFDFNFKTSIHVSEDIDRESEFIPSMLVQPFVENAINHGLQLRKGNGGLLDIDFSKSDGNLICTISDNGIGIKRSKERVNQNHISRGMENVRNRVSVLKTSSVADISISAEELHPGTEYPGTKVTLLIKKKDEDEV
jgi:anti-sigma regulatory factor (Ser/Thr protein kinase)